MKQFLISDLHLDERYPAITSAFLSFLRCQLTPGDKLYILGDFFDVWVGDDHQTPFIDQVKTALKQAHDRGTTLFFMHGNRDFLVGEQFAKETGSILLTDPTTIYWQNRSVILMHGDSLCTADSDYMAFRAQVRDPRWQAEFLRKPLAERLNIAKQLRQHSREAYQAKPEAITDINPDDVDQLFNHQHCDLLIHGHTHRPNIHAVGSGEQKRIVLGDWGQFGWYLVLDDSDYELVKFPIE